MPTMLPAPMRQQSSERPLTGRKVLAMLVAFFAVVAGVNAIMLRAATSTFGGVETGSAYKAGLAFKNEIEAARAQDARHWSVNAKLERTGERTQLAIAIRDGAGRPRDGLAASARFAHPNDARRDRAAAMARTYEGGLAGEVEVPAGQWDLVIELAEDGERVFRSRNRVILR